MQSEPPLIQVEATAKFKRNLRILAKKYRNILLANARVVRWEFRSQTLLLAQ